MQVPHQSINEKPKITQLKYNLHNQDYDPFGSEGMLHLSKGKWKKLKYI
jgi:hypothetical protein